VTKVKPLGTAIIASELRWYDQSQDGASDSQPRNRTLTAL